MQMVVMKPSLSTLTENGVCFVLQRLTHASDMPSKMSAKQFDLEGQMLWGDNSFWGVVLTLNASIDLIAAKFPDWTRNSSSIRH